MKDRKKTLETLVELAGASDATGCWNPSRAIELLRTQSTPGELRELGVAEAVIGRIWAGSTKPDAAGRRGGA
ncbi:MAG TPA: hypothetical protein VM534_08895 [Thermoanaerobaculia bacterium]|nr:hypothetical protein [Thermoanaerobaculia bacterium]